MHGVIQLLGGVRVVLCDPLQSNGQLPPRAQRKDRRHADMLLGLKAEGSEGQH
jgi:hypothetical protein